MRTRGRTIQAGATQTGRQNTPEQNTKWDTGLSFPDWERGKRIPQPHCRMLEVDGPCDLAGRRGEPDCQQPAPITSDYGRS